MKDMTKGSPSKVLLTFAMPIILSGMFQQFYNIADSMIAGKFAGVDALASIGASYQITLIFIAIATGSGAGASVIVARFFGAKQMALVKTAISTSIRAIAVLSVAVTLLGFLFCGGLLSLLQTPSNIMDDSKLYLNIYVLGSSFLLFYNMGTSIFTGLGDSKTPLCFLIFSTLLNIVLDFVFIKYFMWGVFGAAIATFIAQAIACIGMLICLYRKVAQIKLDEPYEKFNMNILKSICHVAIPSIVQQATVAAGQLCIQSLINSYGSTFVAGYSSAIKIDTFIKFTGLSMTTAITNFTAQNIGANRVDRVRAGQRVTYITMAIYSVLMAIMVFFLKEDLIGLFVDSNANQDVIDIGANYMGIVSLFYFPFTLVVCNGGMMRGGGLMIGFTTITMLDLVIRVAMVYSLNHIMGFSAIWWSIPIGWSIAAGVSFVFLKSKMWQDILALKHT